MLYSSNLTFSQNHGRATERVSSFEYLRFLDSYQRMYHRRLLPDSPVVEDEGSLRERLKRVLSLRLSGPVILLLLILLLLLLLGRRSGSGLGLLLLLLLRGLIGDGSLDDLDLIPNTAEDRLVADSVEPPGESRVGSTPLLVPEELEATSGDRSNEEVSQRQTLADKVCVNSEVVLENGGVLRAGVQAVLHSLLVVRLQSEDGAERTGQLGKKFRVGKREPSKNRSVILLRLAEESRLLVLGGDFNRFVSTSSTHNKYSKSRLECSQSVNFLNSCLQTGITRK